MSKLTMKIKQLKLTDKILLSTIGTWFFATTAVLIYVRLNWDTVWQWLLY